MTIIDITTKQVSWEKSSATLTTEASSLGLPSGSWPTSLMLKGTKEAHVFTRQEVVKDRIEGEIQLVKYTPTSDNCVVNTLVVFND